MNMKTALLFSALATAFTFASAEAAVTVRFDAGNVAMAYTDGYYDNDHHFHRWRNHRDMAQYRSEHADQYHAWRHNDRRHRDEDQH